MKANLTSTCSNGRPTQKSKKSQFLHHSRYRTGLELKRKNVIKIQLGKLDRGVGVGCGGSTGGDLGNDIDACIGDIRMHERNSGKE